MRVLYVFEGTKVLPAKRKGRPSRSGPSFVNGREETRP
jgi:hypothetical protein